MNANPEDRELDSETRPFAGVLISHLETCYEHCRFGTIPDEFKGPLPRDIAGTITRIPALRRRWKEMRDQLEPEFVGFVEREMGGKGDDPAAEKGSFELSGRRCSLGG